MHDYTAPLLCMQGILGSTPWNALVFLTLYLQLIGMSDSAASILMALASPSLSSKLDTPERLRLACTEMLSKSTGMRCRALMLMCRYASSTQLCCMLQRPCKPEMCVQFLGGTALGGCLGGFVGDRCVLPIAGLMHTAAALAFMQQDKTHRRKDVHALEHMHSSAASGHTLMLPAEHVSFIQLSQCCNCWTSLCL